MPVLTMYRDGEVAYVNTDHAATYENFLAHGWTDTIDPPKPAPAPEAAETPEAPAVSDESAPEPAAPKQTKRAK